MLDKNLALSHRAPPCADVLDPFRVMIHFKITITLTLKGSNLLATGNAHRDKAIMLLL